MVIPKIKKLGTLRQKIAQLERVIETELYEDLFGIDQRYGFADLKSFIKAVKLAARGGGRKVGRPKKVASVAKIRRRAKITDATRAKVKKLVKAGMSGSKIAKAVKISLPSVQNIKKAAGLVKARKVNAKKATAKKVVAKRKPAKKRRVVKAPANKNLVAAQEPPAPQVA